MTQSRDDPGLVYAAMEDGHRGAYLSLFESLFGLRAVSGSPDAAMVAKLVRAPRLLLSSIDDHLPSFFVLSAIRSALGKPTVAIFLRPQSCVVPTHWSHPLKHRLFRAWRRLPGLTICTILPFSTEPGFAGVADRGLHDPQFWDLLQDGRFRQPPETELSRAIKKAAAGRAIVIQPGGLTPHKGFDAFARAVAADPDLARSVCVAAAGKVDRRCAQSAALFERAGGLLHDRWLSDEELESLYGVADAVWAVYRPDFDQASGVFGRSIQTGAPLILREGARVARFARAIGLPQTTVSFGDAAAAASAIRAVRARTDRTPSLPPALAALWRSEFVTAVDAALGAADRVAGDAMRRSA